jgi:hypothetical protein
MGAGATGKTTLAQLFKREYDLPFLGSVSRPVFTERGLTEADQYKMSPKERLDLQLAIFGRYLDQKIGLKSYVSDRTALDHYAYILYRGAESLTSEQLEDLEDKVLRDLNQHHMLVFCPIGLIKPLEDTFRDKTPANRIIVDALIRGFLDRWNVTYFVAGGGAPEERYASLKRAMRSNRID